MDNAEIKRKIADHQTITNNNENTSTDKSAVLAERTDDAEAPLALKFVFWQPSDQLLIATTADDQLPDGQQVNLLARIVAAIDNQLPGLPQFDLITWPPHPSMQGEGARSKRVYSYLDQIKVGCKVN